MDRHSGSDAKAGGASSAGHASGFTGLDQAPRHQASSVAASSVAMADTRLSQAGAAAGDTHPGDDYDDDELVGTTLVDTYRVLRVLGEGGMGRVYEAQHMRIEGKRYAIKTLHAEFARRSDVRARFQREAEAAASINHPNVVGVYDVNILPDGRPFLVSELLRGQELGEYLDDKGRIPAPEAAGIVRQVCDALQAAHERGVIHRDVKPENVFLTGPADNPRIKVLDFGISRLEGQGGKTLTRTGVVMGTPSYMAPEQARGERVDHRTDMYATGAILYRALTGRMPFDKPDTMATLAAVLTDEPERLRTLAPEVPAALELVVQRAMAREADDRYQQMAELAEALQPFDVVADDARNKSGPRRRLASQTGTAAARQVREALGARTHLVMLLLAAGLALVLGLISVIAAAILMFHEAAAGELSGLEAVLVVAGALSALGTPMFLMVRNVARGSWGNTAKVLELVAKMRVPVLAGLGTSGLLALSAWVIEIVVLRDSAGLSWPLWGVLIPVVGFFVALVAAAMQYADEHELAASLTRPPMLASGAIVLVLTLGAVVAQRDLPPSARSAAAETAAEDGEGDGKAGESSAAGKAGGKAGSGKSGGKSAGGAGKSGGGKGKAGSAAKAPAPRADTLSGAEADALLIQMGNQHSRGDVAASLDILKQLSRGAPSRLKEPRVRALAADIAVRAYLNQGESAQLMNDIVLNEMGPFGPELLFDLMVTRGGSQASRTAKRMLGDDKVQARSSSDVRMAYKLRVAGSCRAKGELVSRAAEEGGAYTLRELKIMKQCGGGGCCLKKDQGLKDAMTIITQRIR